MCVLTLAVLGRVVSQEEAGRGACSQGLFFFLFFFFIKKVLLSEAITYQLLITKEASFTFWGGVVEYNPII